MNEARLRMARIPDGATLIDNPVSAAPGFTLGNVHVMAGVPTIFNAMVETILPTLTGGAPVVSRSVRVDRGEGDVAAELSALAKANPELSFGSYPFSRDGKYGTNLVVRGQDADAVEAAAAQLVAAFGGTCQYPPRTTASRSAPSLCSWRSSCGSARVERRR